MWSCIHQRVRDGGEMKAGGPVTYDCVEIRSHFGVPEQGPIGDLGSSALIVAKEEGTHAPTNSRTSPLYR